MGNEIEKESQKNLKQRAHRLESAKARIDNARYEKRLDALYKQQAEVQSQLETAQSYKEEHAYSSSFGKTDVINKEELSVFADSKIRRTEEAHTPNINKDIVQRSVSKDFTDSKKRSSFIDTTKHDGVITATTSPYEVLSEKTSRMKESLANSDPKVKNNSTKSSNSSDDRSGVRAKNSSGSYGVKETHGESERVYQTVKKTKEKVKDKQISGDGKIKSANDKSVNDLKKKKQRLAKDEKKLKQKKKRKKIARLMRSEMNEMMYADSTYNPVDGIGRTATNIAKIFGREAMDAGKKAIKGVLGKLFSLLGSALLSVLEFLLPVIAIVLIVVVVVYMVGQLFVSAGPLVLYQEALENADVKADANFFITRIDNKIAEIDNEVSGWEEDGYTIVNSTFNPNFYKDMIDIYLAIVLNSDAKAPSGASGIAEDYAYFIVDTEEEETILNNIISCLYFIDASNVDVDSTVYVYRNDKDTYITAYGDVDAETVGIFEEMTINAMQVGLLSNVLVPTSFDDERTAAIFNEANKYLGMAYLFGGKNPETGFDCSGYVCWVMKYSGAYPDLGGLSAQGLYDNSTVISVDEAKPGDLIFFQGTYDTTATVTHVGIYAGNGVMVHCGDPIKYTSLATPYWISHFYAYGRLNE